MSEADRERWNNRYRAGGYSTRPHPSPLVAQWVERLAAERPGGRVLDFACGRGRNVLHLARHGFAVDAIDISEVAIEFGQAQSGQLSIVWRAADLDDFELPRNTYDVIVVSRYLNRERIPDLCEALLSGGTIVYEQHLLLSPEQALPDHVGGPRSPKFRLRSNELLRLFQELRVRYYEEDVFTDPDGTPMLLGRLIADKR